MFKIEDSKMPQTLMRFTKRYGDTPFTAQAGNSKIEPNKRSSYLHMLAS